MICSPPYFPRVPCKAIAGDLPFPHPMATFSNDLGRPDFLCQEMTLIFGDLYHLASDSRGSREDVSIDDMMAFGEMRANLEHRLLKLKAREPPENMTILDYQLEVCRRGALLFLKCVFHKFTAACPILQKAKEDLMNVIRSGEKHGLKDLDSQLRRAPLTWALFMGGILSHNAEEETWFAMRIAASVKALYPLRDSFCWEGMEQYLREIAWDESLQTPECMSLWDQVQRHCDSRSWQSTWPTFPMSSCVTA